MKGYKVFNPDWTCRGFQFEVGKVFEENVTPKCCDVGFHFCTKAVDCFSYYSFDSRNRVAEVEALGDIDTHEEDSKCATNKIHIIRELSWYEVLELVNIEKKCTGLGNTGDWNTGDWNTGDSNTGDWNTGDSNTGDWNTGDSNTGDWNTGDNNTGDWNTGDNNTGDWNTGDNNTGDNNTGDNNTGDWNTGDNNTGDNNTGDWNKTNFSSGCFGTIENKITFFNKPSDWTYQDWLNSDARYLLNKIDFTPTEWIFEEDMSDEEKENYPTYKTTGGYLKVRNTSDCYLEWWKNLNVGQKNVIMSIPNFDKEIFKEITGIDVDKKYI